MSRFGIVWLGLSALVVACTGSGSTTNEPSIPDSSSTSFEGTTTTDTPIVEGPSQSAGDAARDGIVPALAELSVADRVSVVVSDSTPEGVWAISEIPGTTDALDCVIGDREGVYGTDFICVSEYREVLLLTKNLSRIIRAYPLPGQPARLLLVTDEAVYCSRQGDGGLPDSMLCRIDRQDLNITGRIFPYNDDSDYGSPEGNAILYGDWTVAPVSPVVVMETLDIFAGWVVTSGHHGIAYHDPVTLERVNLALVEPTHRVVNVASDDTLNVRRAPGASERIYARLAPTYSGIRATGNVTIVDDGGEWWEVELLDPVRLFDLQEPLHGGPIAGWVNSAAPVATASNPTTSCRGARGETTGPRTSPRSAGTTTMSSSTAWATASTRKPRRNVAGFSSRPTARLDRAAPSTAQPTHQHHKPKSVELSTRVPTPGIPGRPQRRLASPG